MLALSTRGPPCAPPRSAANFGLAYSCAARSCALCRPLAVVDGTVPFADLSAAPSLDSSSAAGGGDFADVPPVAGEGIADESSNVAVAEIEDIVSPDRAAMVDGRRTRTSERRGDRVPIVPTDGRRDGGLDLAGDASSSSSVSIADVDDLDRADNAVRPCIDDLRGVAALPGAPPADGRRDGTLLFGASASSSVSRADIDREAARPANTPPSIEGRLPNELVRERGFEDRRESAGERAMAGVGGPSCPWSSMCSLDANSIL